MAGRTKGVHIALIIFVVLCLLLGVGVYMTYQKWDENLLALGKSMQTAATKEKEISSIKSEVESLKLAIGCPATQRMEYIENMFAQDIEKYTGPESALFAGSSAALPADAADGNAPLANDADGADDADDANGGKDKKAKPVAAEGLIAPESKVYSKLVEILYNKIQEAKIQLADDQTKIEALKKANFGRENKINESMVAVIEQSKAKQSELMKKTSVFMSKRSETMAEKQKLYDEMYASNAENETSVQDLHAKMEDNRKQIKELDKVSEELNEVRDRAQNKSMDKPDGIVLSCNLNTGMAIINLGSRMNLRQQTEFDVYSRDISSTNAGVSKGKIRVLRIVDADNAECLIVKDETNNPIQIGDKIFTSTWTPGDRVLYALAGKCDIDGDGVGDMQRLVNYVSMHGDEVVAYLDGTRRVGAIKPDIRFLVLGEMPAEEDTAGTEAMEQFRKQAKRYNIPEIKLPDLLNRIEVRERTASDKDEKVQSAGVGAKRGTDDRFRSRTGKRVMPR